MKSIFTFSFCFILTQLFAQTFQGSLRPGTQANSAFCTLRSSANFTGNPTNIQFSLAVPVTVGTRPVLTIINNLYSAQFAANGISIIQTASTATDYIYLINFSNALFVSKTYTANTADDVVEISFQGNPASTNNLRLVQLPDGLATTGAGGENGQYNFYVEYQGVDRTNTAAMFYTANGGTVNNNVNGYTAFSAVSLGSSIVLPVHFTAFTGEKKSAGAQLNWSVASSIDAENFVVERFNRNGVYTVATVPATSATNYTYTDALFNSYADATVGYRIRATQRNGAAVLTQNVLLTKQKTEQVLLLNNTQLSAATLSVELATAQNINYSVVSVDGKVIAKQSIRAAAGYQQIALAHHYLPGTYTVFVQTNNGMYSFKAIQP